jgi:hypothetical protein
MKFACDYKQALAQAEWAVRQLFSAWVHVLSEVDHA